MKVNIREYIEEHKEEYFKEIVKQGETLRIKAKLRDISDGDKYTKRFSLARETMKIQELLDIVEQFDLEG